MGSDIQVENAQAINEMMEAAKTNYEKAKTFYEKRREILRQNIETLGRFIDGAKQELDRFLTARKNCEAAIARIQVEIENARKEEESEKKEGRASSGGKVAALEQKRSKLEAQLTTIKQHEEKCRSRIERLEKLRAEQIALLKDWEDRGRDALERCRQETDHAVLIGSQQLAALGRRPGGR